jgi:hypothetical protein
MLEEETRRDRLLAGWILGVALESLGKGARNASEREPSRRKRMRNGRAIYEDEEEESTVGRPTQMHNYSIDYQQ